jgi:hypothetical protein
MRGAMAGACPGHRFCSVVIAGLVPAIPVDWLHNLLIKIPPRGILLRHKLGLPGARPVLDVLFPLDGVVRCVVHLEIDELVNSVSLGEAGDQSVLVLVHSAHEIVGDADVNGTARAAGEDIDVVLPHGPKFPDYFLTRRGSLIGIAGTSPAMTAQGM